MINQDQELRLKISEYRNCITFALICVFGVVFFTFVGITPNQRSLADLEKKIHDAQLQVDIQETLLPIYQSLNEQLKLKARKALPFPEKGRLSRQQTDKIYSIFGQIARESNIITLSVLPDLKSLAKDSDSLLVHAVFKGKFLDFRKFLINLGGQAFLEYIEMIEIKQTGEGKEYRMNIWVALS